MGRLGSRSRGAAAVAAAGLALLAAGTGRAEAAIVDFQSTVVVSPVGTPADNGTALLAAVGGIAASAANPVLLKIEPGIYDVGSSTVQTQEFLDVEGSGRNVTVIRGQATGASSGFGVVSVVTNSELRQMTVENTFSGDADTAAVVLVEGGRARDVAAVATGTFTLNRALLAIFDPVGGGPSASVTDVTATAVTRAVQVFSPGMEAESLTATGREALFVSSGPEVTVRDSVLVGSDFSVLATTLVTSVDFVATQLDGPVICTVAGSCRCVAAYDGALRGLDSGCERPPGRRPF